MASDGMSGFLLAIALGIAVLAGTFFLSAYLWYRHALRVHEKTLFPDNAVGVRMLRYGVSIGFAAFGGFLLAFVFHLVVTTDTGGLTGLQATLAALPFEEVAVGLFLLALATFCVAGAGYATDALRRRFGSVR